jgi:2-polyprenyl-3-methyl-5-hydroxy-6-metoxy-1,4-benzoquinol methylase
MSQEKFDREATTWDEQPRRRELAVALAAAIKAALPLSLEMEALEIGCGTGLLTCEVAGQLKNIVATDTSTGMLAVLHDKIEALGLGNVKTQHLDLLRDTLSPSGFDLIFSAMTLHHIKETGPMLAACFAHLKPGAFLALADLEEEDGCFHDDMTGVEHCGFDTKKLGVLAGACGFVDVHFKTAHRVRKEKGDGRLVEYPVFLMTARRP